MEDEDECQICTQKYTRCKRFKCSCSSCNNVCCVECFKKNAMTGLNFDCMFCDKVYRLSDFYEIVKNKSFMSDLLRLYTENKIDEEKSLFPETQAHVKAEIKLRDYKRFKKKTEEEIEELSIRIRHLKYEIYSKRVGTSRIAAPEKKEFTFIKKCSHSECAGYLNKNWKCGLCDLKTCSKCHNPLLDDVEHVCDEGMVETLELIKKDTKPCPRCGQGINKSSGCNQMFCTSCKFVFDWKTGKESRGTVHNPHYFEYMRSINNGVIPRQPGDNPGGCVNNFIRDMVGIDRHFIQFFRNNKFEILLVNKLISFFQIHRHLTAYETERFTFNYIEKKKNLRVKVMLKDITNKEWLTNLKKIIKSEIVNNEIIQLIQFISIVIDTCVANIWKLIEDKTLEYKPYKEEIKRFEISLEYGNSRLADIGNIHSVRPRKFIYEIRKYSNNHAIRLE